MSATDKTPDEMADEYVLGLLDPSEHARVEAAVEADPVLRRAVAASRDRFHDLDLTARPADISEGLWQNIVADIERQSVLTDAELAPASDGIGHARMSPADNDNSRRWKMSALAAMAASLLLAVGLGWSLVIGPEPRVVAVLLDASGTPLALVEDFGNSSARITPLVDFPVPSGKTMQVWTLPSKELGPVSLGLLTASRTTVLDGPNLPQPQEDQLYEITIEQAGGSPTGRPTGPILVKGFAKAPR